MMPNLSQRKVFTVLLCHPVLHIVDTFLTSDPAVPCHLAARALLERDLGVLSGLGEAVVAHRRPPVLLHDVAERVALQHSRSTLHAEFGREIMGGLDFSHGAQVSQDVVENS